MGDRIFHGELIANIGSHQSHRNNLDIPEVGSHSGSAQFNANANLPGQKGALDVICLHFLGSTTRHLRPCKFDEGIAQNPSDFSGPRILWLLKGIHRTDIRPQA
jgi:hypothetical protein